MPSNSETTSHVPPFCSCGQYGEPLLIWRNDEYSLGTSLAQKKPLEWVEWPMNRSVDATVKKQISGEELDYKIFFQNGIYHPGQCLGQNRFETTSIWGEFTLEAEFPTALIHEPFGFRPRFSEVTIWWNEMSLQLFKMYCHGNLLYLIAYKLFIKQWSNKIRTCLLEMDISLVHTCLGNGFFLYPFIPSFFASSLVVVRGLRFWLFFLETTMLDPVSLLGNVHDCQIGNLGLSKGWDL